MLATQVQPTLDQMELSLELAGAKCPHCDAVSLFRVLGNGRSSVNCVVKRFHWTAKKKPRTLKRAWHAIGGRAEIGGTALIQMCNSGAVVLSRGHSARKHTPAMIRATNVARVGADVASASQQP